VGLLPRNYPKDTSSHFKRLRFRNPINHLI